LDTQNPKHRIAVIDLGSNTARLILLSARPGFSYRLIDEIREVVRLRKGMTDKSLAENAIKRAFSTLSLFKQFCDSRGVDEIIATATSAVRDAPNGPTFLASVEQEIGLTVRVLPGEREAFYGTLGVLNEIPITDANILNIGGGSAQVSEIRDGRYVTGQSFTLGALALTERFVKTDPISDSDYTEIETEIRSQLEVIPKNMGTLPLAGLGGTIRNLATIEAERSDYPLKTLHWFTLTRKELQKTIRQLRRLPLAKRERIAGLNTDRADIILPGAMVVFEVMTRLGVKGMQISESGLREGLFYERFLCDQTEPIVSDIREFGVLNLARNYDYDQRHADQVRHLAGQLFDQTADLHGYGEEERELLDAAATLHDLGMVIGYAGHHKHSQTLIENSGLPGYKPRETALISLLTRYHRKGKPDASDYPGLLCQDDEKRLTCLSALLRTAEYLERGRNAVVSDVRVMWDETYLRISLTAESAPDVEIWAAERNASKLMESVFGLRVVFDVSPLDRAFDST
jgi:exopolyphosphatase/guanosine-5'-triphosphate,3'-diphosphate pyrophosphatase